MESIPSEEELTAHYKNYTYNLEAEVSPLTVASYNALLDEFEKYRNNNRILDVGCGRGWFLEEAKKRGWEVYGTEFSKKAIALCESKGLNMKEGALHEGMFENEFFDVVISIEVIEHLNEPLKFVNLIGSFLRKGGLFYCTTPNFNSLMRYYLKQKYTVIGFPEHLSYYTRYTLKKIIQRGPFKTIKFLSTGISISRLETEPGKKILKDKTNANISSDEVLRMKMVGKWYLKLMKAFVNWLMTVTSTGMILKAYNIKQ